MKVLVNCRWFTYWIILEEKGQGDGWVTLETKMGGKGNKNWNKSITHPLNTINVQLEHQRHLKI